MLVPTLLLSTALAGARPISPAYDGNCQLPTWSPDGSRLSYEVNYHDRKVIELYVYEPGQGDPTPVRPVERGSSMTAGFSTGGGESVTHEVSWAPANIGRFVYSASTASKDYDIFIDQAGPVAAGAGADGGPQWSPDGRWIAFTSARSGQGDLYLVDTHRIEAQPAQLTTDPESAELFASWSPHGFSLIYVGHNDSGDSIYIIEHVENPQPKLLVDWGATQTRPTFSPDGKRVAFYSNHDDNERFDLYVMSLGSKPYPVARGVVMNARGPTWTPDSSHLVYVKDDDDRYDPVYLASVLSPDSAKRLATGTVGNGDVDVVRGTDGRTWLAIAAQGRDNDKVKDFKRVYVMELPQ